MGGKYRGIGIPNSIEFDYLKFSRYPEMMIVNEKETKSIC